MPTFRIRPAVVIAVTFAISVGACTLAHAAPFNRPEDVQAITAIETDMASQTDIDKVMAYFAPGAVVADLSTPGWYEGEKQIRAAYAPQLAAVQSMKPRMDDINIASDGKLACAAMQIHFETTLKDKSTFAMTVRQLDAFKKIGGHWRLIEQHVSLPVDTKTGIGVMNGALPVRGPLTWSKDPIPGPAVSPAQAKKEIRKWLDAEALPLVANDAVRFYGPGDDVIMYDVSFPGEHRGLKEMRDYFEAALAGTRQFQMKMPAYAVDTDGAMGVQIDSQDFKINMKDGTSQFLSFRQSDCMRRVDGKWYAIFEMGSFPVDMKTGKAVMANPAAFQ